MVQFTTRSSRLFAELGPIPHWLYYTPLRKNGPLWSKVVIWLSGIATLAALMGLIVGLMMYSPSRRISIPYKGQKRLHHILGLFFGTVACTWAFSGMLSMEPFPLSSGRPQQGRSIAAALRGKRPPLSQYAMKPPQEALAQLGPAFQVKELELSSFASEPVYLATGARGETRVIRMLGEPLESFDTRRILNVLNSVASVAEARLITQYDAYYLDRTGQRPLPVLFVQLNDEAHSRYYIDPKTAQVVGSYRSSTESWVNRWLYHGLHSINFPWLYNYRPAWDIVVLTLMLGGTSLCVTSVIIGFQLVRRKLFLRRTTSELLCRRRGGILMALFLAYDVANNPLNTNEWAFPVCEVLHILGFAIGIGTITMVNLRLLGLGIEKRNARGLVEGHLSLDLGRPGPGADHRSADLLLRPKYVSA